MWTGQCIDFADFAAKLTKRREALGDDLQIPRNSGKRRTTSKRALLKAVEATGKQWWRAVGQVMMISFTCRVSRAGLDAPRRRVPRRRGSFS